MLIRSAGSTGILTLGRGWSDYGHPIWTVEVITQTGHYVAGYVSEELAQHYYDKYCAEFEDGWTPESDPVFQKTDRQIRVIATAPTFDWSETSDWPDIKLHSVAEPIGIIHDQVFKLTPAL